MMFYRHMMLDAEFVKKPPTDTKPVTNVKFMYYRHIMLDAEFVKKPPTDTKKHSNYLQIIDLCDIDDKDN